MYSDKKTALEALKHCVNLDNPFGPVNCGAGCPLWRRCLGTHQEIIMKDIYEVMLDIGFPAERTAQIYDALTRCVCVELCEDCPYYDRCRGENTYYLLRDVYALLKEAGAYEEKA